MGLKVELGFLRFLGGSGQLRVRFHESIKILGWIFIVFIRARWRWWLGWWSRQKKDGWRWGFGRELERDRRVRESKERKRREK